MAQLNNLIVTGAGRFLNTIQGHASLDLPLSGGSMTGQIVLASTGYKTSSTAGYSVDEYGNFKHQSGTNTHYWLIASNSGAEKFKVFYETGNVTAAGDVTATKFIGPLQGNANTATNAQFIGLYATNEIRFANKPSSAQDIYINYSWADGTSDAKINKYVFQNGNKTNCPVEASKFIGDLQGNATTASKVTTTVTNPSSATTYAIPFVAGDGNQAILGNNGLRFYTKEGTTGAAGWGELVLGNNTSTGTAGNKSGWLKLFSEKSGQAELTYTASATANTTHYLPTTGGTILNTGTTSFTQTITSGAKIGTLKINGVDTDLFAPSSSLIIRQIYTGGPTAAQTTIALTDTTAIGFVSTGTNGSSYTWEGGFFVLSLGNFRQFGSTGKIEYLNTTNNPNTIVLSTTGSIKYTYLIIEF